MKWLALGLAIIVQGGLMPLIVFLLVWGNEGPDWYLVPTLVYSVGSGVLGGYLGMRGIYD